jgi:hypothetical protein
MAAVIAAFLLNVFTECYLYFTLKIRPTTSHKKGTKTIPFDFESDEEPSTGLFAPNKIYGLWSQ